MSEDDRWTDVIDQVLEALDDADVADPSARDALAEGVRQALNSLETGIGLDVQILGEGFPGSSDGPAPVEVVDGGRKLDQPRSVGDTPTLRIADTDETDETEISGEPAGIFTHVKLSHSTKPKRHRPLPGLAEAGWIHVAAPSDTAAPETTWQTLYRGTRPRLYRVACSKGILDVSVDGEAIERLSPGQSIDVDGRAIRVSTSDLSDAIGGYTPLGLEPGEEE